MGVGVNPKVLALGRLKAGVRNQLEAAYERELEAQKQRGEILWYQFEGITFKLAKDTRYTPDFVVMLPNGEMECRETKGFWRDDAKIKLKIASAMFPFRFVAIYAVPKKHGGGFRHEEF
jgi:hypothetical protein